MQKAKFGFVTCVELGLSCMEAIYEVGGNLSMAATLEDHKAKTKSGRVYLDNFCTAHSIPLIKLRSINDHSALEKFAEFDLDWLFVIGWSQIAREQLLGIPHKGVIGMHPTLLPQGRGRAAIPWAILKELPETGVTMFKLDAGVDTGPIIAQHRIPISAHMTATELYDLANTAHAKLMKATYPALAAGSLPLRKQDENKASEWPGRTPADGRIRAQMTVSEAERMVRAVTRPYPGAFFEREGKRVTIWRACAANHDQTGNDIIELSDGKLALLEFEENPITE